MIAARMEVTPNAIIKIIRNSFVVAITCGTLDSMMLNRIMSMDRPIPCGTDSMVGVILVVSRLYGDYGFTGKPVITRDAFNTLCPVLPGMLN